MELTDFQTDVIAASHHQPVVLDFYASWCGPCQMLGPVLQQLAADGSVAVVKADTDRWQDLAMSAGVTGIPDLRLFHRGQEVGRTTGFRPLPQLKQWIDSVVGNAAHQQ